MRPNCSSKVLTERYSYCLTKMFLYFKRVLIFISIEVLNNSLKNTISSVVQSFNWIDSGVDSILYLLSYCSPLVWFGYTSCFSRDWTWRSGFLLGAVVWFGFWRLFWFNTILHTFPHKYTKQRKAYHNSSGDSMDGRFVCRQNSN